MRRPATSRTTGSALRTATFIWVATALASSLAACRSESGPDFIEQGRALQAEIRRAIIDTKSLGRFGLFALFQEEMGDKPCKQPLSDANRHCDVNVIGRGDVRLTIGDERIAKSEQVRKDAVVEIEYPADCENQGFDFKSIDNALPRAGPTRDGVTSWENKRLRVTHWRLPSPKGDQCRVVVQANPAFLERIAGTTAVR